MSNEMIRPFVLSGGTGTRLWPVSRAGMAKQLASVIEGDTLLQRTVARLEASPEFGQTTVIGAYEDRFMLREQLIEIGSKARIVVEPMRRDTFAAFLLAAQITASENPDAVVAVLPSDHLIDCPQAFAESLWRAARQVQREGIAVIGVNPTAPSTAYGYIRPGDKLPGGACHVGQFIEKPSAARAEELIAEGCLWNAGIACFRAGWLLDRINEMEPRAAESIAAAVETMQNDLGILVPGGRFAEIRATSFDYAFLEKTDAAVVVPSAFKWSDLGDWRSVWAASEKDEDGVAVRGEAVHIHSKNTLIHASSRLVCAVGLKEVAVIETPDAVLVVSLDSTQDVKDLVKVLENGSHREAFEHLKVHRPWGWYQTLDLGARFRVKRICVKPGAKLSLQRHHHRAEHWVVVRGTAETTVGGTVKQVCENESLYIPLGEIHRLSNPGKIPVELIEVQTGGYLEEDDIERIEDQFGRIATPIAAAPEKRAVA